MKIFFLTVITMCAFAANSILCRLALRAGEIDPASFTFVRVASGAITLAALAFFVSRTRRIGGSWVSALALVGYAAFFSFSYTRIDAGIGALTLFLLVQFTMIGWNRYEGKKLAIWERAGLTTALLGLAMLTVPGKDAPDLLGLFMMALSGICWGTYSLRGRGAKDPIIATAGNFIRGTPVALVIFALSSGFHGSARGILLAIISGAITSGLGYSVWYFVLPQIPTARAAIAQLSVPALAVLGGTVFLGESWTEQKVISALLMFSGVVIAVRPWPRTGK